MIFGSKFKYSESVNHPFYPVTVYGPDGFKQQFLSGKQFSKNPDTAMYGEKFDLVIGMPGYRNSEFKKISSHELRVTKAHDLAEYYIARGLDLLKPGGVLVYHICANVYEGEELFLDSGENKCKERIAANADILDAYRLPTVTSSGDILNNEIVILRKAEN